MELKLFRGQEFNYRIHEAFGGSPLPSLYLRHAMGGSPGELSEELVT